MESIDLTKELKESKSEHDVKKILVDSYIKETLKKHQVVVVRLQLPLQHLDLYYGLILTLMVHRPLWIKKIYI